MIDLICDCSSPKRVPESSVGQSFCCGKCSCVVRVVSGEQLPQDSGTGDFDAALTVLDGPQHKGERLLLGGVADIEIGKLPQRHISLAGSMVSRLHAKLQRIDFGPSRWKIVDQRSTNGLFVDNARISEHELQDGDVVRVGEYKLQYSHPQPAASSAATASQGAAAGSTALAASGSNRCPSCNQVLPDTAKICVDCGINIKTGRPVLTSQDVDQNLLHENAREVIRWVSLLVWVTPMPIPIRSEAFGLRKPYAIWTIAAITVLCSVAFFIAQHSGSSSDQLDAPGKELMLWPARSAATLPQLTQAQAHRLVKKLTQKQRDELRRQFSEPDEQISDDEVAARALASLRDQIAQQGEFHWYQLITHAFLHDPSSIYNFLMHLAGNLLFMLVFGTRVNALLGDLATAILYPILAICAGAVYLLTLGPADMGTPMLGASGAIMGLAGMYLILFPVHRVFCAMWISVWLGIRRLLGCKIFQLRGFWILLIYFGYDILMSMINSRIGVSGGVAHWAHIGGFTAGMILGLAILFSRLFNTRGGDVLSVILGKNAWPLIGKPSRWQSQPAASLPRATVLA